MAEEASHGGFCQSLCLQPMESVQNSPFCAFPRGTCLMRFCLSLRLQLKYRIIATWVPFWPDRPLGSEPTWPHLHTVHITQSITTLYPRCLLSHFCARQMPGTLHLMHLVPAQRQAEEGVSRGGSPALIPCLPERTFPSCKGSALATEPCP